MQNNLNDRAKIEIQLATYLEIALAAIDEDTLAYVKGRVADLEHRLRQMDE
jgi:hypothetical protein